MVKQLSGVCKQKVFSWWTTAAFNPSVLEQTRIF
jgi:hypothetical protein